MEELWQALNGHTIRSIIATDSTDPSFDGSYDEIALITDAGTTVKLSVSQTYDGAAIDVDVETERELLAKEANEHGST